MISDYTSKKAAFLYMIEHYENNCLAYLDYEKVKHMKLDDLQLLYDYDEGMVDIYQQELLLLESQHILKLV
jgi:hypothetical protein